MATPSNHAICGGKFNSDWDVMEQQGRWWLQAPTH